MRASALGILVLVLLVSLFLFIDIGKGRDANLFFKYPVVEEILLSNGAKIGMPWHIYEARHAIIMGSCKNKEMVSSILQEFGMYPLLSPEGLPIANVGIVEYIDGAAGKYNELYISFIATKSPPPENLWLQYFGFIIDINPFLSPLRPILGLDTTAMVVWKMWVDTETSLLGGREIWGYPKEMAEIVIQVEEGEIQCSKMDVNGVPLLEVGQSSEWPFYSMSLYNYIDGRSATPNTYFHSVGDSKAQALLRVKEWNNETDHLNIFTDSQSGKEIEELAFLPSLWIDMPVFEAVLFPANK